MNPTERQDHLTHRLSHVEKWARFVTQHPTKEWSTLQAELINSQIENALQINLSAKEVEAIKPQKK